MHAGFLQFEPRPRSIQANIEHISDAIARAPAALLVLPELCTTGYLFESQAELRQYAEPVPDGPTCQALMPQCRAHDVSLVLGLPELSGDHVYNSAVLLTRHGQHHVYRKAHLFADEKDTFAPGDSPFPVFDLDSVRIGLLVCFDHFFPEAARSLALAGAQIICHPSNLVLDAAQTTTIARAAENRVYWILANRIGAETLGSRMLNFTGQSQIVAPDGRLVHRAVPNREELFVTEIDPALALDKHATPRNDLFADRRPDLYRL